MRFCSGKARPPPLAVAFQAMIGSSPAVLALARRSSNSATVLGGSVMPDLRGELLVVEDAGQAVVEAHRVEGAGAARPVGPDPVLGELRRRPLVPAEGRRVVVEVLEQPVLDERDHRRQPDQVRRVVAGQQPRRRGHEVRELVLADLPGHVRELLGELVRELERQVEAGLEVGVELDRVGPAARTGGRGARRRSDARRAAGRWRGGRRGCQSLAARLGSRRPRERRRPRPGRVATAIAARRAAGNAAPARRVRTLAMNTPPPRVCPLAGAKLSQASSSTALLRRRRGRTDHQLGCQMNDRWLLGSRASISARRTSAPRRPDSSSCWRIVVSPT